MQDIVKYNNYLNCINLSSFEKRDYDIFFSLCAKVRDMEGEEVTLSFSYIKQLIEYKRGSTISEFAGELLQMNKKLGDITCTLETTSEIVMFHLFNTFRINIEKQTLKITVNEPFRFIVNGIADNFTRFELAEFVSLESKYSKTLYRLFKQFRTTGVYRCRMDDLRKVLGCPESYKNKRVMSEIIKPAVEELREKVWHNLTMEPVYEKKRGRPIKGLIFRYGPEELPGNIVPAVGKRPAGRRNAFNDFEQNEYDFDELEKDILDNYTEGF